MDKVNSDALNRLDLEKLSVFSIIKEKLMDQYKIQEK